MSHRSWSLPLALAFACAGSVPGLAAGPEAPPAKGRLSEVDRMWIVGAAAKEAPGLYLHAAEGKLHFTLRGPADGRLRVVQWSLRSDAELALESGTECRVAAKNRNGVVLVARTLGVAARCVLRAEGEVSVENVQLGRRSYPLRVGPTGRRAASRLRVTRERR